MPTIKKKDPADLLKLMFDPLGLTQDPSKLFKPGITLIIDLFKKKKDEQK